MVRILIFYIKYRVLNHAELGEFQFIGLPIRKKFPRNLFHTLFFSQLLYKIIKIILNFTRWKNLASQKDFVWSAD